MNPVESDSVLDDWMLDWLQTCFRRRQVREVVEEIRVPTAVATADCYVVTTRPDDYSLPAVQTTSG